MAGRDLDVRLDDAGVGMDQGGETSYGRKRFAFLVPDDAAGRRLYVDPGQDQPATGWDAAFCAASSLTIQSLSVSTCSVSSCTNSFATARIVGSLAVPKTL